MSIPTQNGEENDLEPLPTPQLMAMANPVNFPDLDSAPVGMVVDKKYYKFETAGQKIRAIFNGIGEISTRQGGEELRTIPAITFQTKDGVFLNAGAGLVEQFSSIPPGTPVEIEYVGQVKTNSGNKVNKFNVRLLNMRVDVKMVEVRPRLTASTEDADVVTAYWTKIKQLRMTEQDGKDHLAAFSGDFAAALASLEE